MMNEVDSATTHLAKTNIDLFDQRFLADKQNNPDGIRLSSIGEYKVNTRIEGNYVVANNPTNWAAGNQAVDLPGDLRPNTIGSVHSHPKPVPPSDSDYTAHFQNNTNRHAPNVRIENSYVFHAEANKFNQYNHVPDANGNHVFRDAINPFKMDPPLMTSGHNPEAYAQRIPGRPPSPVPGAGAPPDPNWI